MEFDNLKEQYDELLNELSELGELWLEYKAQRRDLGQVERAIAQADKDSRKIERKMRKLKKRHGTDRD